MADKYSVIESGDPPGFSHRSVAIQEVVARRPDFLSRWALLIFLFVLLLLFAGSWLFKYPDLIQSNATLMATNGPKEIVTRKEGKLIRLFVVNDEKVVAGQVIALIESTARHSEIIDLSAQLDKGIYFLANNETEKVSNLFDKAYYSLGELQSSYQQFISQWQQFNDYLVNGYYYKRKIALYSDYVFLKKMQVAIEQQKQLAYQDLQLTEETYNADESLFKDKIISPQDYRDQKSKVLGKQMNLPQVESNLLTNENQQMAKKKEISELEHAISQQKTIFQQALQTLKSMTDDWIKKYIIKSPVDGKVVFVVPLQENQFVQAGKTIGFVNPLDSRYYAQVNLAQNGFGRIDTGQKVQLRFDAYPYQEFGYVEGKLSYISMIPSDSGFLANIELPNGLITNYKRRIQYRNGLRSQALIITRDARLLQRFYYSVLKGINRK